MHPRPAQARHGIGLCVRRGQPAQMRHFRGKLQNLADCKARSSLIHVNVPRVGARAPYVPSGVSSMLTPISASASRAASAASKSRVARASARRLSIRQCAQHQHLPVRSKPNLWIGLQQPKMRRGQQLTLAVGRVSVFCQREKLGHGLGRVQDHRTQPA